MDDYPSNSREARPRAAARAELKKSEPEQPKKIESVVTNKVTRRKKPMHRRFIDTFIAGDGHSVGNYILFEILVPAARDLIADVVSQGAERMVYGEARSSSRRTGARPGPTRPTHVSYDRPQGPPWRTETRYSEPTRRSRNSYSFDDIVLATRVEAEEVLERMYDLLDRYEQVSVADLLEITGETGQFTDEKWGWTTLQGSGYDRIRNGYVLNLPRPEPLS